MQAQSIIFFPSEESAESSILQSTNKGICLAQLRRCKMLKVFTCLIGSVFEGKLQVQFSGVNFLPSCMIVIIMGSFSSLVFHLICFTSVC